MEEYEAISNLWTSDFKLIKLEGFSRPTSFWGKHITTGLVGHLDPPVTSQI